MKALLTFSFLAVLTGCTDGQIGFIERIINKVDGSPKNAEGATVTSPIISNLIDVSGFVYTSVNGKQYGVDGVQIIAESRIPEKPYKYQTFTKGTSKPNFKLEGVPIGLTLNIRAKAPDVDKDEVNFFSDIGSYGFINVDLNSRFNK